MRKLWTSEEYQIIKDRYSTEGAYPLLELLPGRNVDQIRGQARILGIKVQKSNRISKWSTDERALIKQYYPIGGPNEVQKYLPSRTVNQITGQASQLGLKNLNRSKMAGETKSKQCGTLKQDYFNPTWTHEKAYILGYIWADGGVRRGDSKKNRYCLRFECNTRDEEIILQIRESLGSQHKISRRPASIDKRGVKSSPKTRIQICSKPIVESLIQNFGILPRKSYLNLPWPEVPDEFLSSFCRGNFDGDGSVSKSRDGNSKYFCFIGSHKFIEGMQKQILRVTNLSNHKIIKSKKNKTLSRIVWASYEDTLKGYQWLYLIPGIYCLRKKEKFEEILALL